ncbi:MAG: C39 family peptidase [Oliverpabstia sp.]
MKLLKNIGIVFLLIVFICSVLFVPQLISGQKKEEKVKEVVTRDSSEDSRTKLTSAQVAQLYDNNDINIDEHSLPVRSENNDTKTLRKDVTEVVELLFGEDETICEPFKEMVTDSNISYSRSSHRIYMDGQPITLDFVTCSFQKENGYFEILYEDNTKTILDLSCDGIEITLENIEENHLYPEKVDAIISNYYEKQVLLGQDKYDSTVDIFDITEQEQHTYVANLYIRCGFIQHEDPVSTGNTEHDDNLITTPAEEKLIDVPAICQYPELPTGCESVAATMVLQYYKVDITAEEFASDWLACSENFYSSEGKRYGPDPHKVFVGNPFSKKSYGCFAEPIVHAVNRNCTGYTARKITYRSLEQLCEKYIDNDMPLLIWATMNMIEPSAGNTWYLENDTAFTWIAGEHCLVLVGYNTDCYYLNDPISGSMVAYQKDIVEKRFAELGSQAVYISPNES